MHVKRVVLSGFKSYKNTTVELCPGTNIVGAWSKPGAAAALLFSPFFYPRPPPS